MEMQVRRIHINQPAFTCLPWCMETVLPLLGRRNGMTRKRAFILGRRAGRTAAAARTFGIYDGYQAELRRTDWPKGDDELRGMVSKILASSSYRSVDPKDASMAELLTRFMRGMCADTSELKKAITADKLAELREAMDRDFNELVYGQPIPHASEPDASPPDSSR